MKLIMVQDNIEGMTASWACKRQLKDDCEILVFKLGDKLPNLEGRDVFVFGVPFARHLVVKMAKEASDAKTTFRMFDNDFSNRMELSGIKEVKINLKQTPARMSWEHFRCDFKGKIGPKKEDFRFSTAPWIVDYSENDKLWKWPALSRYFIKLAIENCYDRTLEAWDELASRDLGIIIEQGKEYAKKQPKTKENENEQAKEHVKSGIVKGSNRRKLSRK